MSHQEITALAAALRAGDQATIEPLLQQLNALRSLVEDLAVGLDNAELQEQVDALLA